MSAPLALDIICAILGAVVGLGLGYYLISICVGRYKGTGLKFIRRKQNRRASDVERQELPPIITNRLYHGFVPPWPNVAWTARNDSEVPRPVTTNMVGVLSSLQQAHLRSNDTILYHSPPTENRQPWRAGSHETSRATRQQLIQPMPAAFTVPQWMRRSWSDPEATMERAKTKTPTCSQLVAEDTPREVFREDLAGYEDTDSLDDVLSEVSSSSIVTHHSIIIPPPRKRLHD